MPVIWPVGPVVAKFVTTAHGAPPVLSNIHFDSVLNPLFLGRLLFVTEKCKLIEKTSFHVSTFFVFVACNTSSFDQIIAIFTRLWTKATGQMFYFLPFGVFAFGAHCVFRAAIAYCLWNNKVYSTSNKLKFWIQLIFRIIAELIK